MTKKVLFMLIVLTVLISVFLSAAMMPFNSLTLRKDEEDIAESVSEFIPLGTDSYDVCYEIENNLKWDITYIHILQNGKYEFVYDTKDVPQNAIIKEIRVHIGYYVGYLLLRTDVSAFLVFDDNNRLCDITIKKYVDSL